MARKWIKRALGVKRRRVGLRGGHHRKSRRVVARRKGALHRALGIPLGHKIPLRALRRAARSRHSHLRHMAQFALNVRGLRHRR